MRNAERLTLNTKRLARNAFVENFMLKFYLFFTQKD
jgi:hypothetical protein